MNVRDLIATLQVHDPDASVLVRAVGENDSYTDQANRVRSTSRGTVVIDCGEPYLPFAS